MSKTIVANAPKYSTIIEPFGDGGTIALYLAKRKPKTHILNIEDPELFAAMVFAQSPDNKAIKSFDWVASQETFDTVSKISATEGAEAFYRFMYVKKFGTKITPDAEPVFEIFKTGENLTPSLYGLPLMKIGLKNVEILNKDPLSISGQSGAFSILLPKKPEHVDAIKSKLAGWPGDIYFAAKAASSDVVIEMARSMHGFNVSAIAQSAIMMATMGVATNYETGMRVIDPGKPDLGFANNGNSNIRKFTPGMAAFTSQVSESRIYLRNIHNLETRPIPNPALDIVETDAANGLTDLWMKTSEHVIALLGLPTAANKAGQTSEGFTFTSADKATISEALARFTSEALAHDGTDIGPLELAYLRAWAQGVIDAYTSSALDAPVGAINNDAAVAELRGKAEGVFSSNIDKKFAPRLWNILEAGTSSGQNPIEIAKKLHDEFGGFKWKWQQIARSEVAIAHDRAQNTEWQSEVSANAIKNEFDWIPAPDACPICMAMVTGFNGNSAPYTLATMPRLVLDTHPSDRCAKAPHVSSK